MLLVDEVLGIEPTGIASYVALYVAVVPLMLM